MEFATGALGKIIPELGKLLLDEYKLQKSAKEQIKSLVVELEMIYAALSKVGEVPPEQLDGAVKIWAREAREMSYDMEDIIDAFMVRVEGPEPPSKKGSKKFIKKITNIFSKAPTRHEIGQEIKDIKQRVTELDERRQRYNFGTTSSDKARTDDDPRDNDCTKAADLVGIDAAKTELMTRLAKKGDGESEQQPRKVSLVGIGGLGKTTLARAVYDMHQPPQFQCKAFVTVSRNPNKLKVLKDILYELDRNKYEKIHSRDLDGRQLIQLVQEHLRNKRYIVVIDDIWEPDFWDKIKKCFMEDSCGSRIIATTRNIEAAIENGEIYNLPPLQYDNSKTLFYMRICGGKGKVDDNQPDDVTNEILNKCGGIPLATITIASLLVDKPRAMWSELYRAIGFGHKDNRHVENARRNTQVENTNKILSFSYYDMPEYLRTCLLYLRVFPEDYTIRKNQLIWMWIAEGFVRVERGNGLFEVGERYFNNLINRNMIQPVQDEYSCDIKGCRVHDMVLDLIHSLSCAENFITLLDNGEGNTLPENKVVRRLACQRVSAEHITQTDHMDMAKVRSYVSYLCGVNMWIQLSSFKLLRMLAVEHCQFTDSCHLEGLGSLVHLRYLGVRDTNIHELPEQIGNLKFLQTLDIQRTEIEELPVSIVQLTRLVCLTMGNLGYFRATPIRRVPDWIGKLMSLEMLVIALDSPRPDHEELDSKFRMFVKELGSLVKLRVLEFNFDIKIDKTVERDLVESLQSLSKLQHLGVVSHWHTIDADTPTWEARGSVLPVHLRHLSLFAIRFPRLPSCIDLSRLHHLSCLNVRVATLVEQDLKLIAALPELRFLGLAGIISTATLNNIKAGDGCFPKLRRFEMWGGNGTCQFQRNEDSSVSFHIWNGQTVDDMPSGFTQQYDDSRPVEPCFAVMPKLERIEICILVAALKDGGGDCRNIGFEYLPSLRDVYVDCRSGGASASQVEEAKNELRDAIRAHPNSPTLRFF